MRRFLIFVPILILAAAGSAMAETRLELGSTKASVNGMNLILPEAVHVSGGTGMAPMRMLLMESGHSLHVVRESDTKADLAMHYGEQAAKDALDYFKNPCLILDGEGKVFATIGIGSSKILKDGAAFEMPAKTYVREGVFFAPLRDMCKHLGLSLVANGTSFTITRPEPPKPEKRWTDWLLERISLETLLLICFGAVAFFAVLFFILTPLRRIRAGNGKA